MWKYAYVKIPDSESKVCNCATAVSFHQDVLRFDVSMSNGWLSFRAKYLCVKVGETLGRGQCKPHCRLVVEYVGLQVVVEAAQVVVVGDEEHLCPPPCPLDVGGYEAQDVLVSEDEDDDDIWLDMMTR